MKKRIVVTGLGVVSSIGIGKELFWDNLLQGQSGISLVTAFDTSGHSTHLGGEVKAFKPEQFILKKRIKLLGRTSQLAISATRLALDDACLNKEYLVTQRSSVCIGTTMGEIQLMEDISRTWVKAKRQEEINKLFVQLSPVGNISANIALEFRLKGRNRIFTTACASGNYAIGFGYDLLQAQESDIVIAGGADAFSWIAFTGFNRLAAMAPEKCQPFDKNRQGMILGEGAGIVILETLEHALKRNAPIYAEVLGYGLSCDAYHMTQPSGEGITKCMQNALRETNTHLEDVDYISAHGTGTFHNDRSECTAIKSIFEDGKVVVSSIKSMLGHTLGAASAIEALACCLTIKNNIIPPTINYETLDPECAIDCVPNQSREKVINVVLNNGFAFGGNNACLVLKKYNS